MSRQFSSVKQHAAVGAAVGSAIATRALGNRFASPIASILSGHGWRGPPINLLESYKKKVEDAHIALAASIEPLERRNDWLQKLALLRSTPGPLIRFPSSQSRATARGFSALHGTDLDNIFTLPGPILPVK